MMGRKDLEQMLRNGVRRCSNVGIDSSSFSWSKQAPSAPRSGVQNFKAAGVNVNLQNGTAAAAAAESSEPSVIIIDDEESEVESADISSEDGESSSSRSISYSNEEEEDDLQFLGSRNRVYCTRTTRGVGDDDAEAAQSDTGSCGNSEGSSGCEVVGSSQQWKEAALRKQGIKRNGDEAEHQDREVCVEPKVEPGEHAAKKLKTPVSVEDDSFCGTSGPNQGVGKFSHGEDAPTLDREKLRQTAEYKEADQQEWASRQLELQKQALEVQKLKKRKKAEAERKMEMENRQKQRLLEMRESQKKEERNMGLKDQIRGKVQAELERIASECLDLASLLQRLGINLGGGSPSIQQVNAGYKKALLKFHPDRASSSGDIRRQVEAEEKFKLISRMKNVLKPVAT